MAYTLMGLIVSFVAESSANSTITASLLSGFRIASSVSPVRNKMVGFPKALKEYRGARWF
jgi:hypothetical protein